MAASVSDCTLVLVVLRWQHCLCAKLWLIQIRAATVCEFTVGVPPVEVGNPSHPGLFSVPLRRIRNAGSYRHQ